MLYAVLKHPELLERLTAEADALFDQGTLTAEGLHRLDVTKRIFMETLRMYPVIPGLTRTAANSFEFGGYTVPARVEDNRRQHRGAPPGRIAFPTRNALT